MAAASILGFGKNLLYAGVLGAEGLGYYGLVLLVTEYGVQLSHWSLLNGLNTELPLAYGRGDRDADPLVRRSLTSVILASVTTAVVFLVAVNAIALGGGETRLILSLAAVSAVGAVIAEFCALVLRSRQNPLAMAWTYLLRASLLIGLGVAAGALWGFKATVIAEIAALVVALGVYFRFWLVDLRPRRPRLSEVRMLIATGLPLMLSGLIVIATLSVDRLLVASVLPGEFGQYVFGFLVVTVALALNGMLTNVVAPQLMFARGAGATLVELRRTVLRLSAVIVAAGIGGYGVLALMIEVLQGSALREYEDGFEVMRVLYVGSVLLVLNIAGWLLVAARRLYLLTAIDALAAVVTVGASCAVALTEPTLVRFAWVFVAGQAIATGGIVLAAELTVRRSARGE